MTSGMGPSPWPTSRGRRGKSNGAQAVPFASHVIELHFLTFKISCRNEIHRNLRILFVLEKGVFCLLDFMSAISRSWGVVLIVFGGGENHPERMACSLFHLGASQSHFSSQIIIHILTCSKTSSQELVFAFHSCFYPWIVWIVCRVYPSQTGKSKEGPWTLKVNRN